MIQALIEEKEEAFATTQMPFLSHSRINRYLQCPEQYRLYYIENLRPKAPTANLVFGQVVHHALAVLFNGHGDAQKFFRTEWDDVKQIDLTYAYRDSWEKLSSKGDLLLEKFLREELCRLQNIQGSEKVFRLHVTGFDIPIVGIIDLIAELDGKRTVLDFKTSGSAYEDHEVVLSDQLTAYQLAEPDAEQTAFCVLIKTKEPKIEWHTAARSGEQLTEYLSKAAHIAHEITAGHFYKRPGKWCAWCDYLPICTGDQATAKQTLVQIR